jgi:hypothetical protein
VATPGATRLFFAHEDTPTHPDLSVQRPGGLQLSVLHPEEAPPQEARSVKFPSSTEGSTFLEGPTLKAIEVAMNEFLPPGAKVRSDDEQLAWCLSRRENYDVSVLRTDTGIFFVTLSANLTRCKTREAILDAGAVYAIDSTGRILSRR